MERYEYAAVWIGWVHEADDKGWEVTRVDGLAASHLQSRLWPNWIEPLNELGREGWEVKSVSWGSPASTFLLTRKT